MNRPRTLAGSAVPLLLLLGLVVLAPAHAAPAPAAQSPPGDDEQSALLALRRAVSASSALGYTGTQLITAWHEDGATTSLVEVQQWPGGQRLVSAHGSADSSAAPAPGGASGLSDLSLRALDAMAAAYRLRAAGTARTAGRAAVVVLVQRDGRDVARLWLDGETGLPLRQDVFDDRGRLRRMAAFVDIRLGQPATAYPAPNPRPAASPDQASAALVRRPAAGAAGAAGAWPDVVDPQQTVRGCDRVACPEALPGGFALLGARHGTVSGSDVVHLMYGDGLSAISVFLQPGRLDAEHLTRMTREDWGGAEVYVGEGWPARLTWQGGSRVFTLVSDAPPASLRSASAALPHGGEMADTGAFAGLRRGLRSMLGWLLDD